VPADDEVLVRVHSHRGRSQGEVEAVGASVREFTVGDRVFGVNAGRFGTHAEYVCMREDAPLDRTYPRDDVIAATRYVESEQKTGNVLLTAR